MQVSYHKALNVAIQHAIRIRGFVVGAMVLDQFVGHESVGSNLVAEAGRVVIDEIFYSELSHLYGIYRA